MIKILFVAYSGYPNPNIGGSNKIIYEILKRLDYSKFSPSFFSYDALIEYKSSEDLVTDQKGKTFLKRQTGKKLYEKLSFYRYITSSPLYLKIYFNKRDKFFKKHKTYFKKFDIIHIHNSLAAYYFKTINNPKKILTIHSKGAVVSEMNEQLQSSAFEKILKEFKERERIAFKNMNMITFPSHAAKKMYLKDLNLTEKGNTKIIYNGVDIEHIKNIQPDQIFNKYKIINKNYEGIILNIANHVKAKNIDTLIKAVKILKEDHYKSFLLINAGVGYLTDELKALAMNLKINQQIKFLGQIPNDDVIRLMKVCDYLIMPSTRVVFDMVILEALAAGITVIASDEGGNREIIRDDENGYLIENMRENKLFKILNNNLTITSNLKDSYYLSEMILNYFKIYLS